ncbi:GNAT family N-acetyltransferase [Colwellia hornerae]|uniref:GNAT family N-acetyltransferase n=2 Tax=Colwellia hornerae TaxID=89402 RepID=A0A5C6QUT3_9GAMM|nr:GNAT family N-acetyltransferase [Colwellia hornerae]TWX62440.1 GNAT family N-acetyltransferase [Colwellia hornerae]TWX72432.1 GNAT family N-acetyltransferase [Colwellia hornerae]
MLPRDFSAIIALGTAVHGAGYIDDSNMSIWYNKGILKSADSPEINANFVAYLDDILIGFRLTYAINQWEIDVWCSPELWQQPSEKVCYFKCNTVDENYRGYGVGSQLLKLSTQAAIKQGASAGVSHLWKQSPGNSAVKYFTKCGGVLIKEHPDRWNELSKQGYECPECADECHCVAAEMIIHFEK